MGEAISRAACQWKCSLERPAWEPLVLENTEWSLGGVGSSNDREYYVGMCRDTCNVCTKSAAMLLRDGGTDGCLIRTNACGEANRMSRYARLPRIFECASSRFLAPVFRRMAAS